MADSGDGAGAAVPSPDAEGKRSGGGFFSAKTKGRLGGLWSSLGTSAASFADSSKKSFRLAANELSNQIKEIQQHSKDVKEGMQKTSNKLKESDNLKLFSRSGKMATRARASAAKMVNASYAGPMDCDPEAGFSVVYHYSAQLSAVHSRTARNTKAAHAAAAQMRAQHAESRKVSHRALSFQAELAGLPHAMSVLTATVKTIYNLRDGIHSVEAEIGKLEALVEQVELRRLRMKQPMLIEEYKRASDTKVERHRRMTELEYRKARKEASKSAMKIAEERQSALDKVMKEQLDAVRSQQHKQAQAAFPWDIGAATTLLEGTPRVDRGGDSPTLSVASVPTPTQGEVEEFEEFLDAPMEVVGAAAPPEVGGPAAADAQGSSPDVDDQPEVLTDNDSVVTD